MEYEPVIMPTVSEHIRMLEHDLMRHVGMPKPLLNVNISTADEIRAMGHMAEGELRKDMNLLRESMSHEVNTQPKYLWFAYSGGVCYLTRGMIGNVIWKKEMSKRKFNRMNRCWRNTKK